MDPERLAAFAALAGYGFAAAPPTVTGFEPVYDYPVPLGEVAATVHALCADTAASLGRRRGAGDTAVTVGLRLAAASLASFAALRLSGRPERPDQWELDDDGRWAPWGSTAVLEGRNAGNPLVELYPCRDDRWIHLHGGAPRLAQRILDVLGVDPDGVGDAVARWDSFELEGALAAAGTCAAVARTSDEWRRSPQGEAIGSMPTTSIQQLCDAPSRSFRPAPSALPLAGVRVLDLGDGLAGPTCARTLAMYGAEVLQVVGPGRRSVEPFVLDTGAGKRSATLDATTPAGRAALTQLIETTDVLSVSFRPGMLETWGLGRERLADLNPGLVVTSISCYGHQGPWHDRRGWEQLGQVATGLALGTSRDGRPRLAPAAVCDYLTGYLAVFGTMSALLAQTDRGGGYSVRGSLCQTAMWLLRIAEHTSSHREPERGSRPDFDDLLVGTEIGVGTLWRLPSPVSFDGNRQHTEPPARLGVDEASWTLREL